MTLSAKLKHDYPFLPAVYAERRPGKNPISTPVLDRAGYKIPLDIGTQKLFDLTEYKWEVKEHSFDGPSVFIYGDNDEVLAFALQTNLDDDGVDVPIKTPLEGGRVILYAEHWLMGDFCHTLDLILDPKKEVKPPLYNLFFRPAVYEERRPPKEKFSIEELEAAGYDNINNGRADNLFDLSEYEWEIVKNGGEYRFGSERWGVLIYGEGEILGYAIAFQCVPQEAPFKTLLEGDKFIVYILYDDNIHPNLTVDVILDYKKERGGGGE